ncbi:MAG: aspartate--tRNA ligase [bacterium]|nr:aspartate--tRNA ligase [bacterium]MDD5756519.1 aspartate--tRNA ligase [bacterium]
MKRTHTCGVLKKNDAGQAVTLVGWVHSRRDHGGLIFIDVRDRAGITQVVFNPQGAGADLFKEAEKLRCEFVVTVTGQVTLRPAGTENPKLSTGEIEITATKLEVLNPSKTLPFEVAEETEVNEETRLKYRYLDLRRPRMKNNLVFRYKTVKVIRDYLDNQGFVEVETPILTKSTPEGARDYLVPSRVHPNMFFALPQSPQLFKQMLMVAGMEKYFQIAKCFRDEDLRADRQPEHTQIDMEMSFVTQEDIFAHVEGLMSMIFQKMMNIELKTPFPRLTYAESKSKYGSDKPDLRFGLEIRDITEIVKDAEFKVFAEVAKNKGVIRAVCAPGIAGYSRKEIEDLTKLANEFGAKGLAWFKVTAQGMDSPIAKFFKPEVLATLKETMQAKENDLILIVADVPKVVIESLGRLRLYLGEKLNLISKKEFNFLWVVDFPMFQYNDEEKRWESEHHPFTAPNYDDVDYFETDPGKMRSQSYDLVLNGTEIASGSIRIHRKEIQERVFKTLGIGAEEAQEKFGFLLEAFEYGAPPHGGIAPGLDRLVTLMLGETSIREVIAFPKTQKAICPLTDAPGPVGEKQLRELHIKLR